MRKRATSLLVLSLFIVMAAFGQSSPCDLAPQNTAIDQADIDAAVAMVIGQQPCTANINGSGVCNVVTVQRVVNAALGGACVTDSRTVTLNWTASTSTGVVGYNIYRGTVSGGPYTKLNATPVAATTYADTTVQNGLTYFYVARAVNTSGLESTNSNQASAVIP